MTRDHSRSFPLRNSLSLLLPLVLLLGVAAFAREGAPSAADLLSAARRSYQADDLASAATQYRAFLARFADHADAPAAQFELARCLLRGPDPDGRVALDLLRPLADRKDLSSRPSVLFYLGVGEREVGARGADRPEAAKHFAEAAARFGDAAEAFAAGGLKKKEDREWSYCARCAQAEMLLRTDKAADALAVLTPLLKDPRLADGAYRGLALFYQGAASFALKDDMAAGRALNQLAPFEDPVCGAHARLLLARVYLRDDERAEALAHYEAVLAGHAARKQASSERLQAEAEALAKNPAEKARLTALVEGPTPDAVLQAGFAAGVLYYEAGRFEDARGRFAEVAAPGSPLRTDALLFRGCCEVQQRQYPLAVLTLTPLTKGESLLPGQACLWLGRAQAGAADPDDADAYRAALKEALDTLREADALLQGPAEGDDARFVRLRRGEALLEQAQVHERLGEYKEAAVLYGKVLGNHLAPAREQEMWQRQTTAWTLAGDPAAAEKSAEQYEAAFPRGILSPEVQLRRAENAALLAQAAPPAEAARLNAEAMRRFRLVIDKSPEFEHVPYARYGLAWLLYRAGELDKARALFEEIPDTDRKGDLAGASYLLADCLIRTAPARTDDAVAAGKAQEQMTQAADLLAGVLAEQPESPVAPEVLMRLGLCQQRLAALAGQDDERTRQAGASRASFERVLLEHPLNDLQPHAALERARWIARGGDANEAVQRLRPFAYGAFQKHPLAPLAILQLGGWMRGQDGKQGEAAKLLARCRSQYDKVLRADPARATLPTLLLYQHAAALQDAGRFAESRTLFTQLMTETPDHPLAAEAKLVWGEGMLSEGRQKIDAGTQALGANPSPADAAVAQKTLDEGRKLARDAAAYMEEQARKMGDKPPSALLQTRLYYEAAWVQRGLADDEVAAERTRIQEEWRKKQPRPPEGQAAPEPPDVPLAQIALQPAEKKTRALYEAVLKTGAELPLSINARLEWGEVLARREDHAGAVAQLRQALDQEPPADLSARIGLRLSESLFARNDAPAALRQLERVAALADTPLAPQARYRIGAWAMQHGQWEQAIKTLTPFRDTDALKNLPGLTDTALLLLGQAYGELQQWEPSDQAYNQLLEGFADSAWRRQARYGIAWNLHQQQKYAEAVPAYQRAFADAAPEVAVRSQLQIGACQLELKQYKEALESLQAAATADLPEMTPFALAETAHAFDRLEQPAEAEKRWKQVVADHPKSVWAEAAKKRLQGKAADTAAPHTLPEANRLLALAPQPAPPVDPLGDQQGSDQAVFDDLNDEACRAAILARPPTVRPIPSPLLRLTTPEPYEHRDTVRVRGLSAAAILPPCGPLRLPRP